MKFHNIFFLFGFLIFTFLSSDVQAYNGKTYWIANPVFGELMDAQGGVWDGYKSYEGIDLLSGNWRANLRIGNNQNWIDAYYFPASYVKTTSSSITSVLNYIQAPITINMNATMVKETTNLGLRYDSYVASEPWVMQQTYTITNNGSAPLSDIAFYQYYFPSPYNWYPTNWAPSHVDYTTGITDPINYNYDITMYGQYGSNYEWAYTALSTNIAPLRMMFIMAAAIQMIHTLRLSVLVI